MSAKQNQPNETGFTPNALLKRKPRNYLSKKAKPPPTFALAMLDVINAVPGITAQGIMEHPSFKVVGKDVSLYSLSRWLGIFGMRKQVKRTGKRYYPIEKKAMLPTPIVAGPQLSRKERIEQLIANNLNMSNREIGKMVGTSDTYVGQVRRLAKDKARKRKYRAGKVVGFDLPVVVGNGTQVAPSFDLAPKNTRNLMVTVRVGSEATFTLGDMEFTVRAVA